ncbi:MULTISPECIES: response regulator transcription factor [Sphingobium]|nr:MULTISPECIES: response regulator [Sphingobium]AMK26271.1 putative response regulator receiver protein [Sphingobium sp. TKS]
MVVPKIPIVILDDDSGSRRSMQLLLQGRGFDVRSFASPELLIADVKVSAPACLVTDYRMAGHDGLQVLDALRAAGWRGAAILVTAYGSPELMQKAIAQGFQAVLDKPCKESALVNAVIAATRRERDP